MALAVGHRDRILLLYLRSRFTEPYRSPPAAAGDRKGQHHSFPLGSYLPLFIILFYLKKKTTNRTDSVRSS